MKHLLLAGVLLGSLGIATADRSPDIISRVPASAAAYGEETPAVLTRIVLEDGIVEERGFPSLEDAQSYLGTKPGELVVMRSFSTGTTIALSAGQSLRGEGSGRSDVSGATEGAIKSTTSEISFTGSGDIVDFNGDSCGVSGITLVRVTPTPPATLASITGMGIDTNGNEGCLVESVTIRNNATAIGESSGESTTLNIRHCVLIGGYDSESALVDFGTGDHHTIIVEQSYFSAGLGSAIWINNSDDAPTSGSKSTDPCSYVLDNIIDHFGVEAERDETMDPKGMAAGIFLSGAHFLVRGNVVSNTVGRGLHLRGARNVQVMGGIYSRAGVEFVTEPTDTDDSWALDNYAERSSMAGILVEDSSDLVVEGVHAYFNGGNGLAFQNTDRIRIMNGQFHSNAQNGTVGGGQSGTKRAGISFSGGDCDDVLISGNHCFNHATYTGAATRSQHYGLRVATPSSGTNDRWIISDNSFDSTPDHSDAGLSLQTTPSTIVNTDNLTGP